MDKKVYVVWNLETDKETVVRLTEEQAKAIDWFINWIGTSDLGCELAEDYATSIEDWRMK